MLYQAAVPGRHPDLIVRVDTEADVVEALQLARERGLRVVCRTSGHNTAGAVLRDGGILLDLSRLNRIEIDVQRRVATLQPAATNGAFREAFEAHDLAFPIGDCDSVAIGGYLLGGGLGKNSNHWTKGFCSNALLSADVILASGDRITVDAQQHSDIFWALRGCGPGFFGVIVSVTVQLFDPIRAIVRDRHRFSIEHLPAILQSFDDRRSRHDDRVNIKVALTPDVTSPDGVVVDVVLQAFSMADEAPADEAHRLVRSHIDPALERLATERDAPAEFELDDLVLAIPRTWRTKLDNVFTDDSASLLRLVDLARRAPAGTMVGLGLGHGALVTPEASEGCLSPGGRHLLQAMVDYEDDTLDGAVEAWMAEFAAIAVPFGPGGYINQIDNERDPERIRDCFPAATWERLAQIRARHDPDRIFYSYLGTDS